MKNSKLNVEGGADSVAAVGDEVGGCEVAVVGAGGNVAVANVAVASEIDAATFFAVFLLLEGAGMFGELELDGRVDAGAQTQ